MPNFTIEAGSRFPEEFYLTPVSGYVPTDLEKGYIESLSRVMESLSDDKAHDPTGTDDASVALSQARTNRRNEALRELKAQANDFLGGHLVAATAADNAFVIRGKYVADLERQSNSLFLVEPKLEHGQVVDVFIVVADDLPVTSDLAAQEKQKLYVSLDSARTIVKTVARRIEEGRKPGWLKRLWWLYLAWLHRLWGRFFSTREGTDTREGGRNIGRLRGCKTSI